TLVHMAQPWAMRERLVDGKGNFGSIEDDPPAAMRYTEARLTHLGAALMQDMDRDTVDFVPNYDERMTEPTVFPSAFPNLLVNRAALEEKIAELVNEKIITEISAMRNKSDENTRLVMELKRDGNPKVVIANLYKHTQLEVSFAVNALAIDHGKPKTLNLKAIIQ